MFIGLKETLNVDQKIDLKLNFSDGSSQTLEVPVKMVQRPGMKKEMKH
jgi:copper(I)-binding protein